MSYKQVSRIATTDGILALTDYPVIIANNQAYVENMAQGTMETFVISCRNYTNKILSTPDNTMGTLLQFTNGNKIEFRRESWGSNNWGPLYIQLSYADDTYYWATTYQRYDPLNVYGSGGCKNILILILESESDPTDVRISALGLFGDPPYSDHAYALPNMYNFLNGSIVPAYTWQPVSHLAGNNGQFNMQLSQLNAAIIGDGSTAASSTDPEMYSLSSKSSIYNMLVNIANNEETPIVYCGGNYCTVTRRFVAGTAYDLIYFTLKFYFRSDTLIYTSPEIDVRADHNNDRLFSMIYDSENEIAALDLITTMEGVNGIFYNNCALPSAEEMQALYIWLQDNGESHTGPYDTGTTDNGGDPSTPRPQDHITPSTLPTKGGLNTGLFTLYLPTDSQMAQIADFLWSDNVLDNFKKYFNNFADNILACYSLPFTPSNLGTKAFKVGKMVSDTITNVAYSEIRCFDIDMGSVTVKKLWDSYLDFAPFTKAEIYLPFIGLHSLDIDEIMCPTRLDGSVPDRLGTVLSLTYRLDILTGVVVAMLKVRVYTASGGYTDEIRYQFTGKVGYSIPLTGQTYANMTQGIVTALAGVASTIATGGLTAPMTAAAAVVGTVQASKPNVERIGNISGDASMLATNVPYLILTSPNKPELIGQDKFTGFPSYKSGKLSEFSGYTEVLDAHVEGMNATETEKEMILNMLKGGVII